MSKITVWTRQNKNVLKILREEGRYIVRKEYICAENEEHTGLILQAYDWLVTHGPHVDKKPKDVTYPVWVSYTHENTYAPGPKEALLTLSVDAEDVTPINIAKWGMILNYSYIPQDAADSKQHQEMLSAYGINDAQAVMTQFYPEVKREIMSSWSRLFDKNIQPGNAFQYGNIWEIKKAWVVEGL